MLEHGQTYPLPIGIYKIVKTIPDMPGYLAFSFLEQVIIYSLKENRVVATQKTDSLIISLDVSKTTLHGQESTFISAGCENNEVFVFNLIGAIYLELKPLKSFKIASKRIVSAKTVSFKMKNYLFLLLKYDEKPNISSYGLTVLPFDGGLPVAKDFLFNDPYNYCSDEFRVVPNEEKIDIYIIKSKVFHSDIVLTILRQYSFQHSFNDAEGYITSCRKTRFENIPAVFSDTIFFRDSSPPLFFFVGDVSLIPFCKNINIKHFNKPVEIRSLLLTPKIISQKQTLLLEINELEKKINFLLVENETLSWSNIFITSFIGKFDNTFFYEIVYQDNKPFVLFGDITKELVCLDLELCIKLSRQLPRAPLTFAEVEHRGRIN